MQDTHLHTSTLQHNIGNGKYTCCWYFACLCASLKACQAYLPVDPSIWSLVNAYAKPEGGMCSFCTCDVLLSNQFAETNKVLQY